MLDRRTKEGGKCRLGEGKVDSKRIWWSKRVRRSCRDEVGGGDVELKEERKRKEFNSE